MSWIRVAAFSQPLTAHILLARLRADGIDALLFDEHLIAMDWLYSHALGGVRVMVPHTQAAEARSVIEQIEAGALDIPVDAADQSALGPCLCPHCGRVEVRPVSRGWALAFWSFFMLNVPLPFRRDRWVCRSCQAVSRGPRSQSSDPD